MNRLRLNRLFALLLLLVIALPSAALPPPPVAPKVTSDGKSDLRLLYPAGRFYEDGLFPLVFEFHNTSLLDRTYTVTWGSSLPVPSELKNLKLPPDGKRRFSLVFPRNEISNLYNLEVNKKSQNHELLGSPRNLVSGILAPKDVGFEYLRALSLEVDQNYNPNKSEDDEDKRVPLSCISRLDAEVLPESWDLLSALDVIVAYDLPALSLSSGQQEALLDWTRRGGTLVLVSNGVPEEYSGSAFLEHLPLQPKSVSTEHGFLHVLGEAKEEGYSAFEFEGVPILYKSPMLRGKLVQITTPIIELGKIDEQTCEQLWRVIYDELPDNVANNYYNRSRVAHNVLNDIPEHPRARAGLLAGFLLLYALIVGPINLGYLRKKDKMLWSFVTVPAIAILFAGGAYVVNMAGRSSTPALRELGVLEIPAGAVRGLAESHAILYSPRNETYRLASSPRASFEHIDYRGKDFGLYHPTVDGGLETSIELGTWDIMSFVTDSVAKLERPIQVRGTLKDGALEVEIDSPFSSLGQAVVFDPKQGISDPFDLTEGSQTRKITFQAAGGYDKFSMLADPNPRVHPGHSELLLSLSNENSRFPQESSFLLFFTDKFQTELEADKGAKHAAEFLVVVEFEK